MGQYKDLKEIHDLDHIVSNRFCWLLGMVAKMKNRGHSLK